MIVELYKKINGRWKQIEPVYKKEMEVQFKDADDIEYTVLLMKEEHEIKPTRPLRDPAPPAPEDLDPEE